MTPNRALQHFKWKLQNSWKPTAPDIEAYNALVAYNKEQNEKTINDNQLFGKLYIYLFGQFVNYYQSTALDDIPQKELHKLLDKDLSTIVQEVTDNLNLYELKNSIEAQKHKDYKPMEYSEVAENLKIMVNGALNTYTR